MHKLSQTNYFKEEQVKVLSKRGIKTIQDLLYYLPRRYIDRSKPLELKDTRVGDVVTFIGQIKNSNLIYARRRRLMVQVSYQGLTIELVFFQGIPYFQKMLSIGVEAAFSGAIDMFRGKFTMTHPEVEIMSGDKFIHTGKITPLYKITDAMRKKYITSRALREVMHQVLLDYRDKMTEHIPIEILEAERLMKIEEAFQVLHFPMSMNDIEQAKSRLAFDELIVFSSLIRDKKSKREEIMRSHIFEQDSITWPQKLVKSLPFPLTGDQHNAIETLRRLSLRSFPYGALLQGDVGSGKTLVGLMCALQYMEQGVQVALMAPTEILARQHYRSFIDLLFDFPFIQVELLLGKEKAADKRVKIDRLKRGDTLLVVGTHSLIQTDVEFSSLGLIIIDEQHRFGVEQREALRSKGQHPDLLAMTATPIPRSLTLTLYGDLEIILIKEKPPGRLPIDTRLFEEDEISKLYMGVKKYVDQGRQAYIVYPIIDESDKSRWASIMADYDYLEKKVFKDYRLGLLHGRLSTEEKDRAMVKFKEGLIQVLVTTTVVEVGIDVPNATLMLIRNAEKFGLSQLHQLRGRVGRGEHQSFCILIKSKSCTSEGELRLEAMVESEDGFYLAQRDLEIRGTGELLGLKQAGISEFKVADLRFHSKVAERAAAIIEQNDDLYRRIKNSKDWKKYPDDFRLLV